ncbi:hypothetical protein BOX15_Mlig005781g1 [Macrostomum lignano]|uniref:Ras-related protein Rab-10 n=1 Tax=Macrostomum lignano TaxID=282301 RepID=A0A267GGQ6_9PLAT|nr:hypothetical protein BOX15_Mlig005781g2 [Macrostomum lignano]PAA85245.1 hypothetical protein BOX15_Mlig005781g1 [Macrostomum lignano]
MAKAVQAPHGRFKIVLLGESSVGKTCLLRTLIGEEFSSHVMSTIGIDFKRKKFTIGDKVIELEIWDTAGQEKFRTITSFHYRNARGIVLLYDITNRKSFDRMKTYWLKSISEKADSDVIPVFMVGNKLDLESQRQVPREDGVDAKERYGSYGFFETSSKTGENVQDLFTEVASVMVSMWKNLLTREPDDARHHPSAGRRDSIKLGHTDAAAIADKKAGCCGGGS